MMRMMIHERCYAQRASEAKRIQTTEHEQREHPSICKPNGIRGKWEINDSFNDYHSITVLDE